jgi:hypothetical protein
LGHDTQGRAGNKTEMLRVITSTTNTAIAAEGVRQQIHSSTVNRVPVTVILSDYRFDPGEEILAGADTRSTARGLQHAGDGGVNKRFSGTMNR